MRLSGLGLSLLLLTVLWGSPAFAMPPVVGFIAGAAAAITGSAPLVLSGIAATTSAYAAGAFAVQAVLGVAGSALGAAIINAALGVALNTFITGARGKSGSYGGVSQPKPQDLQSNFMLSDQPRFWVMGVNRIGGGISFAEGKDGALYKQVAHCDSEATSEEALYLNDILVTLDGDGYVEQDTFLVNGTPYVKLLLRDGVDDQVAQAGLTEVFPEWTAAHVGAGVSDTLMVIKAMDTEARAKIMQHRGILGLGEPDITRVAYFGRNHDPRVQSSDPSDPSSWPACDGNPALIAAAHRMDEERFGWPASSINWEAVATAADVCDEAVLDRYGNSAPRYQCALSVNKADESNMDTEKRILGSFDGMVYEDSEGRWSVFAGAYVEPDVILTDEDVFEIESVEADDGENTYSHFYAQYTEPGYGYKGQASAPWVHPDWTDADAVRTTGVEMYPVLNHRQAVTLAQVAGMRQNERLRVGLIAGPRARRLRERRFVRLDLATDDTLSGVYEVAGFERKQGPVTCSLVLIRVRSDWWTLEDGVEGERPNLSVTVANDVSLTNISPGNMVISAASIAATSGGSVARLIAAFPAPERPDRLVQIQYRLDGTTSWEQMSVRSEDGAASSGVVSDGSTYECQWRVVSLSGDTSEWSGIVEVVAVADQTAPDDLSDFAASVSSPDVALSWAAPSSSNFYAVKVMRADYVAGYSGSYDLADAAQVREEIGLPGSADGWTDEGLSVGHYAYWALPLNGSRIAGSAAGPITVDIS